MDTKRKALVSLVKTMHSEIDTFSVRWDSMENKDLFVKSIGKYAKLKRDNRPMYDKIKCQLAITDKALNDLTMYIIQNHLKNNSTSTVANAARITAMSDFVIERYFAVCITPFNFVSMFMCSFLVLRYFTKKFQKSKFIFTGH